MSYDREAKDKPLSKSEQTRRPIRRGQATGSGGDTPQYGNGTAYSTHRVMQTVDAPACATGNPKAHRVRTSKLPVKIGGVNEERPLLGTNRRSAKCHLSPLLRFRYIFCFSSFFRARFCSVFSFVPSFSFLPRFSENWAGFETCVTRDSETWRTVGDSRGS